MLSADSRRFALVPEPRRPVERIDGKPVPRIELWLWKRPASSRSPEETWSLILECEVMGGPRRGHGMGDWVIAHLERTDPAQELPALPAELEAKVQALVADAAGNFASFAAPGEPRGRPGTDYEWQAMDFPFVPWTPRRLLRTRLMEEADPRGMRDFLVVEEDERQSSAQLRLGLMLVRDANALTRHAINARFDEVVARLDATLDGWRHRVSDVPGAKEDFQVRLASFDGIRPDGRPVWIVVERMTWLARPRGQAEQEITSLALYVGTDHHGKVGYDLASVWRQALEGEGSPLAAVVRELGDPLEGVLHPGDLVAPVNGMPIELSSLVGANGEDELRIERVRDGRFGEQVIELPRLSLDRWKGLQAACTAGELTPEALSMLGARLEGGELVDLMHALVAAGEADFAELPVAHAGWLEHRTDRELHTVAVPLWKAETAPSPAMLDALRAELADAFDYRWLLEPYSQTSGPFWDYYSRQTHWAARREGPKGLHPWVELVEVTSGDGVVLELRVLAFSVAHREANAGRPERLWFQPIGGDCEDGYGVAWCYREGVSFDGRYQNGVPDGWGEHIFSDGSSFIEVVYEKGRMKFSGRVKPPPPPPLPQTIATERYIWVEELGRLLTESEWQQRWEDQIDPADVGDPPHLQYVPVPGEPSRTCVGCNGIGTQWHSREYEVYEDYYVTPGTSLYNQGYTKVRHHYGTRQENYVGACTYCDGLGRIPY